MSNGHLSKKQKNCAPEDTYQAGGFWDHTAITPDSKLIVSLVVGKRTKEQTQELVSDTQSRFSLLDGFISHFSLPDGFSTSFARFKRTSGGGLRAKQDEPQKREVAIACELLNRMRE